MKEVRFLGTSLADLGFPPEEVAVLTLRAELMVALRKLIATRGWTQAQAAEELGVTQSRVSDLVRGKHEVQSRHAGHPCCPSGAHSQAATRCPSDVPAAPKPSKQQPPRGNRKIAANLILPSFRNLRLR